METIDQIDNLAKELADVKNELLKTIDEYHQLTTIERARLNYMYEKHFGDLETDLCKNNNQINELQDIIDKISGYSKTNKSPSPYNSYTSSINNQKVDLTSLYRKIVKKIHPDKSNKVEHQDYWEKVQEAYQSENTRKLKMFYEIFCFEDEEINNQFSIKSKIRRFNTYLYEQKSQITKLAKEEPFCLKDKLQDSNWVNQKRSNLKNQLESSSKRLELKKKILNSLSANNTSTPITKLAS